MSEQDDVLDEGVSSSGGSVSLEPIKERANFAKAMMYVMAGLSVLSAIIGFYSKSVLQGWMDGTSTLEDVEGVDTLNGSVAILFLLAIILAAIAWCRWKMRAMKNVHKYGLKGVDITPGWAAGWYFVPIANLWMPYKAMNQVFKGSQAIYNNTKDWMNKFESKIVGSWWALYIIGGVINQVGTRQYTTAINEGDIDGAMNALMIGSIGDIVTAGAAVVAAMLVTKVVFFQTQRASDSTADSLSD